MQLKLTTINYRIDFPNVSEVLSLVLCIRFVKRQCSQQFFSLLSTGFIPIIFVIWCWWQLENGDPDQNTDPGTIRRNALTGNGLAKGKSDKNVSTNQKSAFIPSQGSRTSLFVYL